MNIESLTQEWLDCFDESVRNGECLADSVFWRLALHTLPEGVNVDDVRVKQALRAISKSVAEKDGA